MVPVVVSIEKIKWIFLVNICGLIQFARYSKCLNTLKGGKLKHTHKTRSGFIVLKIYQIKKKIPLKGELLNYLVIVSSMYVRIPLQCHASNEFMK